MSELIIEDSLGKLHELDATQLVLLESVTRMPVNDILAYLNPDFDPYTLANLDNSFVREFLEEALHSRFMMKIDSVSLVFKDLFDECATRSVHVDRNNEASYLQALVGDVRLLFLVLKRYDLNLFEKIKERFLIKLGEAFAQEGAEVPEEILSKLKPKVKEAVMQDWRKKHNIYRKEYEARKTAYEAGKKDKFKIDLMCKDLARKVAFLGISGSGLPFDVSVASVAIDLLLTDEQKKDFAEQKRTEAEKFDSHLPEFDLEQRQRLEAVREVALHPDPCTILVTILGEN